MQDSLIHDKHLDLKLHHQKKTIETKSFFPNLEAKPAPVATGTQDATMPDSPNIPTEKSARCMEPPFPLQ